MKKRRRRKWPFVLVAVLILAGAGVWFVPKLIQTNLSGQTDASVASATVEKSDISTTVVSTGNLTGSAIDVPLPYNVSIDTILVEKGDAVNEGDQLATLNKSSLSTAISDVKEELTDVTDDLTALADEDVNTVLVTSKASGRVKAVYAKAGDSAADVTASKGALILLSLDGKMAVDIPSTAAVNISDSVTVTLSDGTQKTGKVAASSEAGYTVTLSDNGPKLDDQVTVKKDKTELGGGKLYIHSPLRITNNTGEVKSLSVSENRRVYNGTTLLKLYIPSSKASYQTLQHKQAYLLDLLEKLNALYANNYIRATTTGTVGDILVTAGESLTKSPVSTGEDGSDYDNEGTAFSILLGDKMAVTVTVDELDISAVEAGQEVSLALDAIEGETFSGTVTEVADTAEISGNVASYTATIVLEKAAAMKVGMSATATIINQKKAGVLVIPMDALQEYGDSVFVYTTTDDSGVLGGQTEVETGLSDGTNVEVVSGLNEGDTVYYVQTTSSDSTQNMMMRPDGGMMITQTNGGGPGNNRRSGEAGGAPPAGN